MTEKKHFADCLVCGKPLKYLDESIELSCELCGETEKTNVSCEDGHFICDSCHFSGAAGSLALVCKRIKTRNPIDVMTQLMKTEDVHMHGPEHHILVGVALLTAYGNVATIDFDKCFEKILERGKKVPGGICGNWGACGAAIGTGIFLSVITDTNPLSRESWGLCNKLTSECLADIAGVGGPRCCKRNTYLSILRASTFLKIHLNFELETSLPRCEFNKNNKECLKKTCPFFYAEV